MSFNEYMREDDNDNILKVVATSKNVKNTKGSIREDQKKNNHKKAALKSKIL